MNKNEKMVDDTRCYSSNPLFSLCCVCFCIAFSTHMLVI